MPRIEEVHRIIEVLESVGVKVAWNGSDVTIQPPKKLALKNINEVAAKKTRALVMMIGALMHRYPTFNLPQSGGCKLGSRSIKPHLYALEPFGVNIKATKSTFSVTVSPDS